MSAEWDLGDDNLYWWEQDIPPLQDGGGELPPGQYSEDTPVDETDYSDYDDDQLFDPHDMLVSIFDIDPGDLRGVAFGTVEEVWEWLESLGLEGFSYIVEIDDWYYPVVGDSDGP